MLNGKKIVVVLPAFRAAKTLEKTVGEISREVVDEIILVDDSSNDETVQRGRELGLHVFVHQENLGYGANQKTCYFEALALGADVVIMVHPDYQYDPRLVVPMAGMLVAGVYDVVIASRILGTGAIRGGMPLYKYYANRFLTLFQNIMLSAKLSEYHTGYRAFSRTVLEQLPLLANSDDFLFDNQMLVQAHAFGYSIGEISCPTRYTNESSSINFRRSCIYGFGVLGTSILYRLWKWKLTKTRLFNPRPTLRLTRAYYSSASAKEPASK